MSSKTVTNFFINQPYMSSNAVTNFLMIEYTPRVHSLLKQPKLGFIYHYPE